MERAGSSPASATSLLCDFFVESRRITNSLRSSVLVELQFSCHVWRPVLVFERDHAIERLIGPRQFGKKLRLKPPVLNLSH